MDVVFANKRFFSVTDVYNNLKNEMLTGKYGIVFTDNIAFYTLCQNDGICSDYNSSIMYICLMTGENDFIVLMEEESINSPFYDDIKSRSNCVELMPNATI